MTNFKSVPNFMNLPFITKFATDFFLIPDINSIFPFFNYNLFNLFRYNVFKYEVAPHILNFCLYHQFYCNLAIANFHFFFRGSWGVWAYLIWHFPMSLAAILVLQCISFSDKAINWTIFHILTILISVHELMLVKCSKFMFFKDKFLKP